MTAAVKAALTDVIDRGLPVHEAVSAAVQAHLGVKTTDNISSSERPSERRARQNADALKQLAELELTHAPRNAAAILAKRLATDPTDPDELEVLAQHFRRLRRRQKNEHCSVANEPIG